MLLHPDVRDYFIFRYADCLSRCVDIPFGWGRYGYWLVKMMRTFGSRLREMEGYRVLTYREYFQIATSWPGRTDTKEDEARKRLVLRSLMKRLGLQRNQTKGF